MAPNNVGSAAPRQGKSTTSRRHSSLLPSAIVQHRHSQTRRNIYPMRRAALAVARSTHRPVRRVVVRSRLQTAANQEHIGSDGTIAKPTGTFFTSTTRNIDRSHLYPRAHPQILLSSMQLRSFSIALASSLVASGAYWAYQGTGSESPAFPTQHHFFGGSQNNMVGPVYERQPIKFDAGALESVEYPTDIPVVKQQDPDPIVLEKISPKQATDMLRKHEQSYFVERGQGVVRYDSSQLPSNNPIEDDYTAEWSLDRSGNDWMFWGIFDGHGGYSTSYMLRKWLVQFVGVELSSIYDNANQSFSSPSDIDLAIKQGFLKLDDKIVHESALSAYSATSKAMATHRLRPAMAGSCALLSFYDTKTQTLRVACTGDSRAVLGRRGPNGLWTASPLSTDYTGSTPEEVERLRREHPNEPNVVRNGRILGGLEPSRAFGDASYKWSREVWEALESKVFLGRSPRPYSLTPPYVTAEPVVTTTKIQPEKGDFVIMATDGLWEWLTSEEAVGLVGKWLDEQKAAKNSTDTGSGAWLKSWLPSKSSSQHFLPVERAQQQGSTTGNHNDQGQRDAFRETNYKLSDAQRFVVEDKNVATHLVRNALGGQDKDRLCGLLTLAHPVSRRYRDDITVEVIFFGEGSPEGEKMTVKLNSDASGTTQARL